MKLPKLKFEVQLVIADPSRNPVPLGFLDTGASPE
jgi:hypothetical protein